MPQYVASLSYGKDSMAMLHVIKDVLDLPLDRIITADVWATDTIPADLPPMVEFKAYADKEIKRRWGIEVEHFYATNADGSKRTFEELFYKRKTSKSKYNGYLVGWPMAFGQSWCNGDLKRPALNAMRQSAKNAVEYVGIASNEPIRIERHREKCVMPLVDANWTEENCYEWAEKEGLLAPTYKLFPRSGCWFCINQNLDSLRFLRGNYPDLYNMMLRWDADTIKDNPTINRKFRADGKTLQDIEKRFRWEDLGYKPTEKQFRWADVENPQMNIEQWLNNLDEMGGDDGENNN